MRGERFRSARGPASQCQKASCRLAAALLATGLVTVGCAELQGLGLEDVLRASGAPSEARVAAGLREALRVGTERATATLSRPGGFANVPTLRLTLPEPLQPVARTLRSVGLGRSVDNLEAAMNRAAENAAGEAVPVFADALGAMTIADAVAILNGPDDAATRYFEEHTSAALRVRFAPVVDSAMQRAGVYQTWREAVRLYDAIPMVGALPAAPDLQGYVLDRTLDGLFSTLAGEEARIRADPAARTSELLREVFGRAGATSGPAR